MSINISGTLNPTFLVFRIFWCSDIAAAKQTLKSKIHIL